jgi:glycine/D-amino acid oxidase-like deaminating enzyme
VVVGGGIAGFLTAYRLTEAGLNVTLIEANTLFSGVTQFTTAHIEALQGVLYSKLDDRFAKLYFESQLAAIDGIEALIKAHKIDCDFKRLDSYLMTNKHGKALAKNTVF